MGNNPSLSVDKPQKTDFPGSALLEGATDKICGSIVTTDDGTAPSTRSVAGKLLAQADEMCISSPVNQDRKGFDFSDEEDDDDDIRRTEKGNSSSKVDASMNPTAALFARALVSEVTDNPQTMTPAAMAEREKRLLKAQEAARKTKQLQQQNPASANSKDGPKPIGTMGKPNVLGSIAHSIGIEEPPKLPGMTTKPSSVVPPSALQENRAQVNSTTRAAPGSAASKHSVTIGLSLSRRQSSVGHPDTVTRQTAFDFNEVQDRAYKYVSATDANGWLAGGGERGGGDVPPSPGFSPMTTEQKIAAPDVVHIPIITIDAESSTAVDAIIAALARGEIFIPHMALLPEALSVTGVSPPDLVVRFGCEHNDDTPPDEWSNWCLEFMHNQLYEYFAPLGAKWTTRPFQITLARKVRWKTVKHMNRYFSNAERVIDAWREKGPKYLDPQLSYIEGGASPEEVARPHGIYLLRNGVPTNYFAPNFEPPYTTKMTRSLLSNVLAKSWDKNRREWTSEPVQRLVTPTMLVANLCGCADQGGFMANEVTNTAFADESFEGQMEVSDSHQKDTAVDLSATSPDADETVVTAMTMSASAARHVVDPVQELRGDYDDDYEPDMPPKVERRANPEAFSPSSSEESPTNQINGGKLAAIDSQWDHEEPPTPEKVRFRNRAPSPGGGRTTARSIAGASEATTALHTNTAMLKEFRDDVRRQEIKDRGENENVSPESAHSKSKSKKKRRSKAEIEKERARQIALVAGAQDDERDEVAPRYDKYTMNMNGSKKQATPGVQRTDSGTSLEYSIDSSILEKKEDEALPPEAAENLPEGVPTDEALFKVGWAKALDQKSGSFYYFTLDRTKIVWENPLDLPGSSAAKATADAEILPKGAFAI